MKIYLNSIRTCTNLLQILKTSSQSTLYNSIWLTKSPISLSLKWWKHMDSHTALSMAMTSSVEQVKATFMMSCGWSSFLIMLMRHSLGRSSKLRFPSSSLCQKFANYCLKVPLQFMYWTYSRIHVIYYRVTELHILVNNCRV